MQIQYEAIQQAPGLPFKYYRYQPGNPITVQPHWHPQIELNCLVSGGPLNFVTDGHTTIYQPGAIWAVNRHVVHSATGPDRPDWDEFGLIITDDFLLSRLPQSARWDLHLDAARPAYAEARRAMLAIAALMKQPPSATRRLSVLAEFYQLLVLLDHHFATLRPAGNLAPSVVDAAIALINADYAKPLSVAILAEQLHVSQTSLNQQFQQTLNRSVSQQLRLVRLLAARRLLLETTATVGFVADASGFGSEKSLTRNFKAWKGLTPSAYRRRFGPA